MLSDIKRITAGLELSPALLEELIDQIPSGLLKEQRIPGKWSIHQHACHLVDVQQMIISRFHTFQEQENPVFEVYLPGATFNDDFLMELELKQMVMNFPKLRLELLDTIAGYGSEIWGRSAIHPEYVEYNPHILLRHTLMHDHFHMYRIEELWLTQESYLRKR